MDNLYTKIEKLCLGRGIDITTMCKNAGISRASLSELKMGRTKSLSAKTLEKIASYFDVPTDYLLRSEVEQNKKLPATENRELEEVLEHYRTRPELKILFSVTKNASPESIIRAARIVEALEKEENE